MSLEKKSAMKYEDTIVKIQSGVITLSISEINELVDNEEELKIFNIELENAQKEARIRLEDGVYEAMFPYTTGEVQIKRALKFVEENHKDENQTEISFDISDDLYQTLLDIANEYNTTLNNIVNAYLTIMILKERKREIHKNYPNANIKDILDVLYDFINTLNEIENPDDVIHIANINKNFVLMHPENKVLS